MQRENELLRERIAKLEKSQLAYRLNSKEDRKKVSSSENQSSENNNTDSDDLESTVSPHSSTSMATTETIHEQPKYFDRKRRLLAAEQQMSTSQCEPIIAKKTSPLKKACLDDIVDSLNQKAQAEREDDEDNRVEITDSHDDAEEQQINKAKLDENEKETILAVNHTLTPPSTTTEREDDDDEVDDDEDIDIEDPKLTVDDDH